MAKLSLFYIFYSTFFTILSIAILGLILITPADAIQQALNNRQLYNVFVIAGGYVLTAILAILIYVARLYTTRSLLAAIPKTWVPVEKGDVSKKVREMIVESLTRSAIIAWDARPRVPQDGEDIPELDIADLVQNSVSEGKPKNRFLKFLHRNDENSKREHQGVPILAHSPVWGEITHEGWSSPTSEDLPNLEYMSVILELPHLIEAKAVSLAPTDPESSITSQMPDPRAVEVLQRPSHMGLRDYVNHLTSLGVISTTAPITAFNSSYEVARFSGLYLPENDFRELMKLFADILRVMNPLNSSLLEQFDDRSDFDDSTSSSAIPETPRSRSPTSFRSASTRSGSEGTIRTNRSRRPGTNYPAYRPTGLSTAPVTPFGLKGERFVKRSPSAQSFKQTQRPYELSQASSNSSLRSSSAGSVIVRPNPSHTPADLPYTLHLPPL